MQLLRMFPEVLFDDSDGLADGYAVIRETDGAGRPGPFLIKFRSPRKPVDLAHAMSRLPEIDAVRVGNALHDFDRLGAFAQQCVTVVGCGGRRIGG